MSGGRFNRLAGQHLVDRGGRLAAQSDRLDRGPVVAGVGRGIEQAEALVAGPAVGPTGLPDHRGAGVANCRRVARSDQHLRHAGRGDYDRLRSVHGRRLSVGDIAQAYDLVLLAQQFGHPGPLNQGATLGQILRLQLGPGGRLTVQNDHFLGPGFQGLGRRFGRACRRRR